MLKPATDASAPHITRSATPPTNTEDVASQSVTLLPNFSVTPSTGQFYLARIAPFGGLQSIDYSYHIRDYLRGINLDAGGNPSLTDGRLFSMKLDYEADGTYYDGNIRKQMWLGANDSLSRSYTYVYDLANRLTSAAFSGGQTGENYSLETVSYDKNGNLYKLWRRGKTGSTSFGYVDQLAYTYTAANGNKVSAVNDAIANANDVEMFKDAAGTDYTYWENGALKSDNNKGISQIQYNHLELTKRIEFTNGKWISYFYDGGGNKLRKTTSEGLKVDYVGAIIYQNDTLYQVAHDEGRYSPTLGFEFSYTDHLGNVRLMFRDSSGVAAITQTENFGAWGESLKSLNYYRGANSKEQFVFTGHERDDDLGVYDAKARMYDPLVPRFWSQDAESETYLEESPYVYVLNNPMNAIDPDGKNVYILTNDGRTVLARVDDEEHTFYQQDKAGKLKKLEPFGKDQGIVGAYLANTTDAIFSTLNTTASGGEYDDFKNFLRVRAQSKGRMAIDDFEELVINTLSGGGKAATSSFSGSVLGARHHVFPKVFGGFKSWAKKYIYNLSDKAHKALHDMIDSELKQAGMPSHRGKGNSKIEWERQMNSDPTMQGRVIQILKKVAGDIDKKYGTQVQRQLDQIIKNGDYKKIP